MHTVNYFRETKTGLRETLPLLLERLLPPQIVEWDLITFLIKSLNYGSHFADRTARLTWVTILVPDENQRVLIQLGQRLRTLLWKTLP